jgi:hypothetical protein
MERKNWTTADEINYINSIGTHHEELAKLIKRDSINKINMLKGYVDGMMSRKNWGLVDSGLVTDYAFKLLRRVQNDHRSQH